MDGYLSITGELVGDLGNRAPTNQNLRLELDRFKRSSLERSTDVHGLAGDSGQTRRRRTEGGSASGI